MISINYLNIWVVQLFLLHFVFHSIILPILLALYLNEGALSSLVTTSTLLTMSSLLKLHELSEVWEELSLYSIKLYISIVILIKLASSTRVPLVSVDHFSNGAQFLNATCVIAPEFYISSISSISLFNSNISCD